MQSQGVAEIGGAGVAGAERHQTVTGLDQLQDRCGVVDRMVDEALLGKGRDDDGGNPRARPPFVGRRRRDMVPQPAILVISHDDDAVLPQRAVLDRLDDPGGVGVTLEDIGITWVLILLADRLEEGDGRQGAGGDVRHHDLLVLQMLRPRGRAVAVFGEIGEGSVMVLEELVAMAGHRVVPATRIPSPADALVAEAVADGRHVLGRQ